MTSFKQFVENIEQAQSAIQRLLAQCEQLPDLDNGGDVFGPDNHKQVMISFFKDVLRGMDENLAQRLQGIPLDGDPYQVFRTINSGGHPVRDYLILKANNLNRPSQP